jgi:TRAP-type C4-dicarboxylate transport system substrate-binding protein
MKVAVVGESARWFESMGAAPVAVAAGDFYMSLERGLVDGQWAHWPAMNGFKLTEVTNSHTIFGKNGASLSFTGYLINLKTWSKLPADIQKSWRRLTIGPAMKSSKPTRKKSGWP